MKILVTGSDGFIGKLLALELSKAGHQIIEFDSKKGNNILNTEEVKKAVMGIDAVYHLAASLREDDPNLFETNVQGTKNLLEAAETQRLHRFTYLSTAGVMGEIKGIGNEQSSQNPQTPYEKSKAEAEELVLSYQEILPITIVRSAIVMGPNNEWKEIIKMVKKNFPLIGSGKNFWQTVYAKDLVDALVFLLDKKKAVGETFIVAEEKPKTLKELVQLIRKELEMKQEMKTIPNWLGVVFAYALLTYSKITGKKTIITPAHVQRLLRNRHYSIEKIKKLGWRPKYSTEEAVKETIAELKPF
ncbi:MAG: NAD-dependent epimerase/dehydratase family protein [Candidatus Diapherotrites archaeon]|nr:NAD-dependent epimerase/dehydratase family protein [Candidatus Diapherotrites archaeon]